MAEEHVRILSEKFGEFDEGCINAVSEAEQRIRNFCGTPAELKDYAWETLTPVLSNKFQHACSLYPVVHDACYRIVYESCRDAGDGELLAQRGGYMQIRMEDHEKALDEMAAGFTRKITFDEVSAESPEKYRAFLNELLDMGKRNECSLNEQKLCSADLESERVLHMALSYRHVSKWDKGGTIDEEAAKLIAETVHEYLKIFKRRELRLWVDQVSSKNRSGPEMEWGAIGLLPYATLRVMIIPNSSEPDCNVDYLKRPWLFYELYAGMMAAGVFVLRRKLTPDLNHALHIEELSKETRNAFVHFGVLIGFGYPPFLALDLAMARCLTDHELSIQEYEFGDQFAEYCNWAIRRGAWKEFIDIGWGLTKLSVDSVSLQMYVNTLCNPLRGFEIKGHLDPLVRGTKYGTRKRQGPLCLQELFNCIPSLPSESARVDQLFTVAKLHERENSERFRITRHFYDSNDVATTRDFNHNIYVAIRGNQIRLCEGPTDGASTITQTQLPTVVQMFEQDDQATSASSNTEAFRSKFFPVWPLTDKDSEFDVSRESLLAMREFASRVGSSSVEQVSDMLSRLPSIAANDRRQTVSEYTETFRMWVDVSLGSSVTVDTIRIARKLHTNDPKMCDDLLCKAINDIGNTVSHQNLKSKMDLVCWQRAKDDPAYSHVLEIASDRKQGLLIYITDLKSDPVTTRRRIFTLNQQRMFFARYVFVLLCDDMDEDDIDALASLYGAVSPRTVQTPGEWPLYSRVPNAGSQKPKVKLPEQLVEGGVYVGFKKYWFHAEEKGDHRNILAEGFKYIRSRIAQVEHHNIIRSQLVLYSSSLEQV